MTENDIIQSRLQSSINIRKKKEAWARIVSAVNALSSGATRTEEDCRKKWKDLKSASMKQKVDVKKRVVGQQNKHHTTT